MSLTEQVLLHRDAQLLGMEIVSEPSSLVQQLEVVNQVSTSARPGELSEDFQKLFSLKQKALAVSASIRQYPGVSGSIWQYHVVWWVGGGSQK